MGEIGVRWTNNLDKLISRAEKRWNIDVGDSISGGSSAFVAKAHSQKNSNMIIKISLPDEYFKYQINALLLAKGNGYVKLLEYDLENQMLLLEELGKSLNELNYTTEKQIEIICNTLKKPWTVPPQLELLDGIGGIDWFKGFIKATWAELNEPCSISVIEKAYKFLDSRLSMHKPDTAVLVHGDAHSGNVLLNLKGDSFKLVDPGGLLYEKAYDLGVLMREWTDELLPDPCGLGQKRCDYLSRITRIDKQAIWEWGFIQTVATGLLCMKVKRTDFGNKLLAVADAWRMI
jgi:streptomycin 6-kinase